MKNAELIECIDILLHRIQELESVNPFEPNSWREQLTKQLENEFILKFIEKNKNDSF